MIKEPNWEYQETITKPIQVEDKEDNEREVTAIDLNSMPFILDVSPELSMQDIQIGETYQATIKIYTAKMTPEVDELWFELEKENPDIQKYSQEILKSGEQRPLYKFELIKIIKQ